jgi:hypothetical protein
VQMERVTSGLICLRADLGSRRALYESRVIHPEHVPGAICIPPAPDASASTLAARAPVQVAVRILIVRLMSYCTRKPI